MHHRLLELRGLEIVAAMRHLPRGGLILEIGAGSGWQAKLLEDAGHRVVALDVDSHDASLGQHHPVALYDGVRLPVADAAVDAIFSSNVMEHVRDVPALLAEMRRVLRPGGIAVHVIPTPTWRAWTIAGRYPYLVQLLTRRRTLPPTSRLAKAGGVAGVMATRGVWSLVSRVLVEPPHGEFKSSWHEVFEYQARRWIARFECAGWRLVQREPAGLFYTGYGTLPRLSIDRRRALARMLGSACTIFVLELAPPGQ